MNDIETSGVTFGAELTFEAEDIRKAQAWARERGYRYEDVRHLMFDALQSGVVHSRFKEAI